MDMDNISLSALWATFFGTRTKKLSRAEAEAHNYGAPIHKLTVELFEFILACAAHEDEDENPYYPYYDGWWVDRSRLRVLMAASLVCRRWTPWAQRLMGQILVLEDVRANRWINVHYYRNSQPMKMICRRLNSGLATDVFRRCGPALSSLSLKGLSGKFEWSYLQLLTGLRNLDLQTANIHFVDPHTAPPLLLPLESLSINIEKHIFSGGVLQKSPPFNGSAFFQALLVGTTATLRSLTIALDDDHKAQEYTSLLHIVSSTITTLSIQVKTSMSDPVSPSLLAGLESLTAVDTFHLDEAIPRTSSNVYLEILLALGQSPIRVFSPKLVKNSPSSQQVVEAFRLVVQHGTFPDLEVLKPRVWFQPRPETSNYFNSFREDLTVADWDREMERVREMFAPFKDEGFQGLLRTQGAVLELDVSGKGFLGKAVPTQKDFL
ncbi:hypothetical protein T439DRAFT_321241 [Meredithblackwellia eburnea MCA 4105]